ncbi:helix-hairpin-helix domain-containing protein [Geofilum sp. OHC36d9]|uniref:helix-hairpin-helix domain-containing protein n=1 Tax=Geofilum sp. OHC36d9 TaxID=3458413 RepID=UPI0040336950
MWKDFLSFTRREQRGLIVLFVIIIVVIGLRIVCPLMIPPVDFSQYVSDVTSVEETSVGNSEVDETVLCLQQSFNPNTVTREALISYGVGRKVADNWVAYLQKGGYFKKKEDVRKIYGLNEDVYQQLKDFLDMGVDEQVKPKSETPLFDNWIDLNSIDRSELKSLGCRNEIIDSLLLLKEEFWFPSRVRESLLCQWNNDSLLKVKTTLKPRFKKSNDDFFVIGMNLSDTADWAALPGIGPVLSRRIVAYRNRLGGFAQVDQLMEVYGISPHLFDQLRPYLRIDRLSLRTINVNTASLSRLRNHPYLDYYKARAIVEGRRAKKRFNQIDELLNLDGFDTVGWHKTRYYLSVTD